MNDFVRDNEAEEYTKISTSLWSELAPAGPLEQNFTTEIVSATWRLRRCRMADEALGLISIADPAWSDPMLNPATEKQQKSVDRARAHSHNVLRRSIAEPRALQTERTIRLHLDVQESIPGLTNTRQLLQALKVDNAMNKDQKTANPEEKPKEEDPAAVLEALMAAADQQLCQQYRDSVTKESMSGTYPDSDRSEDRQPLVGGGAGGSACPGRDREAERSSGPTSAPPKPDVVASNCKAPAPPANEAPPQPDVTKESIARPYPNSDRAEDQQPLTKESMARPYPDSDSSEDQQPLVSGASFCKPAPQPPVPPKQTPRNAPCPCGSGQKYKRCHGGPNAPAQKQAA
jgi:hypothetical protein